MYPSDLSIIYCYQKCRCNPHEFESFSRSETNVALVFCVHVQMWTNSTERILLDSIICANLDGKIVHIQLILSVSVNFAEKKHLHNLFILLVLAAASPEF